MMGGMPEYHMTATELNEQCKVGAVDEEHEWLPNPYQAQADAQILAGAWPGTPLLLGCPVQEVQLQQPMGDGSPWNGDSAWSEWPTDGSPCMTDLVLEGEDLARQMAMPAEAVGWDDMASWNYIYEQYIQPVQEKTTGGSSSSAPCESTTDEGEAEAEAHDTVGSFSDHTPEVTENDETATVCTSSERPGRYSRKLSHQCVPKKTDFGKTFGDEIERDKITTLMVRNIPNMYTRSMLMEELDSLNFQGEYDFIYLPMDKSTQWNVGYAFVNFSSPSVAMRCAKEMTSYTFKRYDHGSGKVAQISIAHIQGLQRNLDYYSNTAVQCARIQTYRPLVLTSKSQHQQQESYESPRKPAHRRRRRVRSDTDAAVEQGVHRGHADTREALSGVSQKGMGSRSTRRWSAH